MPASIGGRGIKPWLPPLTRRTIGLVSALTLIWLPLAAGTARAHAIVESTTPRADQIVQSSPDRVLMEFSEPVEISFGAIRVFDTDAQRVDAGETFHLDGRADTIAVPLSPALEQGTYTVTWRVVSADGHPISEAFVFHVGKPGPKPEGIADQVLGSDAGSSRLAAGLFGVVRWANFTALLLLAGSAIFLVAVWRPAEQIGGRSATVEEHFSRRIKRLILASWVVAAVATVAGFVLQGAVAGGVSLARALSGDVMRGVLETRYGLVTALKAILLLIAAALWVTAGRSLAGRPLPASVGAAAARPPAPRWIIATGAVVGVVLLSTPGLAGHAGTTPPVWINLVTDNLHIVAAAAWAGGLVALIGAAFPATRGLSETEAVRTLGPVVSGFSELAMFAVGIIIVTGTYRAWVEVGGLSALTGATYGWVLITKLAVFVPLIILGAINNRWTKPRIMQVGETDDPEHAPLRVLRRLVKAEVALVAVVLAVTALLVNLAPARVEAGISGPFITDVRLGSFNLNVLVDPNEVGENQIHLTATTAAGAPARIEAMEVLFTMRSEGIGPLVGEGTPLAPGHFVVQGRQLSVPGEWTLEVSARTGRFKEDDTTLVVVVNR